MNCMNFRIMIQAVMKGFGRSTDKRIEENSNSTFRHYLYSIVKILPVDRVVTANAAMSMQQHVVEDHYMALLCSFFVKIYTLVITVCMILYKKCK